MSVKKLPVFSVFVTNMAGCVSMFSLPAAFLCVPFLRTCAVNETWRQVLRCCGNRREG